MNAMMGDPLYQDVALAAAISGVTLGVGNAAMARGLGGAVSGAVGGVGRQVRGMLPAPRIRGWQPLTDQPTPRTFYVDAEGVVSVGQPYIGPGRQLTEPTYIGPERQLPRSGPIVGNGGIVKSMSPQQREIIQRLADKHEVEIQGYGSRARGNWHADSDWDYRIGGTSKIGHRARSGVRNGGLPRGRRGGELNLYGRETGIDIMNANKFDLFPDEPFVAHA
jgi:hypothetical protein